MAESHHPPDGGRTTSTPTSSATKSETQGSEISKVAREDESGVLATGSPSVLQTPQGNTTIADGVVSKIAGLAAREVSGAHALGGGAARAFGSLRDRIPGASTSTSSGVNVEVGEAQAAVDLDVVAEHGVSIADLSRSIRKNVIDSVEGMTGLEVVEVNVSVDDIHLPSDDVDDQPHRTEQHRAAPTSATSDHADVEVVSLLAPVARSTSRVA